MKVSDFKDAMGPKDGDYLRLENRWAIIYITRQGSRGYELSGNIATEYFSSLSEAITRAVDELGAFQLGRASVLG